MPRCLIDAPVGPSGVSEILHAAVHEAGHAVIARAFGIFGGGARIYVTDEGVGGNTITAGLACLPGIWSRSGKHSRREVALRAKIIIAAAGGEAELLMYGWMRGDDVDRRNIELLLARLPLSWPCWRRRPSRCRRARSPTCRATVTGLCG
jgi:hypothetical protein